MVDPAFEKMPAETVTIRMCLYSRVFSISEAIFAKHFSPLGEQKSPFCDSPLTSGSIEKATCASEAVPSFFELGDHQFGDAARLRAAEDHFDGRDRDSGEQLIEFFGREALLRD